MKIQGEEKRLPTENCISIS